MKSSVLDFSKAPFRVDAGADPEQVAREMVACFRTVSCLPQKLTQCFCAAMRVLEFAPEDTLSQAGNHLTRAIDTGIGAGDANPYHNAQHFCEVLLNALCVSQLTPLERREQAQLLVAALIHDFHHDGKLNGNIPFRLERMAIEAATPYLTAAGVQERERGCIAAMVLATEVPIGTRFARHCCMHFSEGVLKPEVSNVDPVLRQLADDARLALRAVLLTEADVLSSVGLTVEYGELQQEKLSQEWNKPMCAADKLHFLDQIFQDFMVSRFFSPNLYKLKLAMRRQLSLNAD